MSGRGPGFPSRGWFFPIDTPRGRSCGFGPRQPTLDVQGRARNAELPSPEVSLARGPRRSQRLCYQCQDRSRPDSAHPRMAIRNRHWLGGGAMLRLARQTSQGVCAAGGSNSRSGSDQTKAVSAAVVQARTRPRERPKARLPSADGTSQGASQALSGRPSSAPRRGADLGSSEDGDPEQTLGGRWPCCGSPDRFRKESARQATAARGSTANRRQRLRPGSSHRGSGQEATRPAMASGRTFVGRET